MNTRKKAYGLSGLSPYAIGFLLSEFFSGFRKSVS